ncbi:uncharacterized protein LOC127814204 [Diospyros lotus]|uniref:uncharacterized protein LOC127814204 n=1 Tax=Diospyros lotus TaxID=55363 RepID=UPI00225323F8|nr:uncharacterized protein LOC127814204 [Diospyros lotus]
MMCMRSFRSQTRRGSPCPLMKIFLEWVNSTTFTVIATMAPGGRNLRRKKIQGTNIQLPTITTRKNCQQESISNVQNIEKGGRVLRQKTINRTAIQFNSDKIDGSNENFVRLTKTINQS